MGLHVLIRAPIMRLGDRQNRGQELNWSLATAARAVMMVLSRCCDLRAAKSRSSNR
jgi:hypothetical protein